MGWQRLFRVLGGALLGVRHWSGKTVRGL
jgi:hypothetical protein